MATRNKSGRLAGIDTGGGERSPIVVLYGPAGTGKTTLAASAPTPIFIDLEDSSGFHGVERFPQRDSYDEIMEDLKALATEKHSYKTLVVDSLTRLMPMMAESVSRANGWPSIGHPPHGKGYQALELEVQRFMRAMTYLRTAKGMAVILIAHDQVEVITDPVVGEYIQTTPRLDKRMRAAAVETADVVGYLGQDIVVRNPDEREASAKRAMSDGTRVLYISPSVGRTAKCRVPGADHEVEIPESNGWKQVAAALRGPDPAPARRPARAKGAK